MNAAPQCSHDGPPDSGYDGQDLEALADIPRYYDWIVHAFGPFINGRVLEVGAGTGNFSARFLPFVDEATLVEPDARLCEQLTLRFNHVAQVNAVRATAKSLAVDGVFDAVVAVNVLEHIDDDAEELRTWAAALRPGGAVLLFVPALRGLFGSLDIAVKHHRRYTPTSLRQVTASAGLRIVRLHYFDSVGVLPWFIVGRVLRMSSVSRRGAILYDRIAVPVLRRLEGRVKPPIGKNLVCVAVKPE